MRTGVLAAGLTGVAVLAIAGGIVVHHARSVRARSIGEQQQSDPWAGAARADQPPANTRITCEEWFEMNASQQADAVEAAGKAAQADFEREHSRKISVPADYAGLADEFTSVCNATAKEDRSTTDLYTNAKLLMQMAFGNQ